MSDHVHAITGFNPDNLTELGDAIEAAVMDVAQDFGVEMTIGAFNYDDVEASCKVTLKCTNYRRPDGELITGDQRAFELGCERWGLAPSDYGRVIEIDGDKLAICGLLPSAKKHPILVESVTASSSRHYRVRADTVRKLLTVGH